MQSNRSPLANACAGNSSQRNDAQQQNQLPANQQQILRGRGLISFGGWFGSHPNRSILGQPQPQNQFDEPSSERNSSTKASI